MFKVSKRKCTYSLEPCDSAAYTKSMDKIYTRFAKEYDYFMIVFPLWKKWLLSVMPYIKGKILLEVSFGPGFLLSQFPNEIEINGLDYNTTMVTRAIAKMKKMEKRVDLKQGNVEHMPYNDEVFDTIINTMAFSGYPDGDKALKEMLRVLKPDGRLLILDYDYPQDYNIFGYLIVKLIEKSGDVIRDIGNIIDKQGVIYKRRIIGGFGSVQLFVITKKPIEG